MEHWHMRKEVTMGTIIALVVYLISLVIIFAKLDARVENLERSATAITDARIARVEATVDHTRDELGRLEQRTVNSLTEIHKSLRRIEDRLAEPRNAQSR